MSKKSYTSRNAPEEIDEYLLKLPEHERVSLQDLRDRIKALASKVTERIGYQIPIMRINRDLVGFASQKDHLSFYTMSPGLMKRLKQELEGVKISGATIHFTADNPIPDDVLEKIIKARLEEDEANSK
jgi:uncharacterized protein YdhG (YjbR/CyaY superfamily)